MANKKKNTSVEEKKNIYPIEVCLKANNPYHGKVVCNGLIITSDSWTLIASANMMTRLKNIEKWIQIKEK